jgi:hypothetical protein
VVGRQLLDLLTPVVPRERWHPNFQRIIDLPTDEEHRIRPANRVLDAAARVARGSAL